MVITILEGKVSEEKWAVLQNAYINLGSPSKNRPSQSFLVQDHNHPQMWKIISIWKEIKILQKARESGKTPTGILIFRKAGVEPLLNVFDVKENL